MIELGELLREAGGEAALAPAWRDLPAFSALVFEHHLRHARVDLALRCTSLDRNRAEGLIALCARWPALAPLVWAWAGGRESGAARVETLWFELERGHAQPSLFLDLSRRSLAAVDDALARAGRPLTARARASLEHVRAFAPGLEPEHCGLRLARPGAPLRVRFGGLPARRVDALATHLGVHAPAVSERYTAAPVVVHVDVDAGGRLGPGLGVELRRRSHDGWCELLELLVEDGLCSPAERADLLGYPACTPIVSERLRRALSWLLPHDATHFIRRISHVKLVCDGRGDVVAKAYLHLHYY